MNNTNETNGNDSDNWGVVNIIIDGPGDRTVRPCPPELLAHMQALKVKREKIIAEFGPWPPENGSSAKDKGSTSS